MEASVFIKELEEENNKLLGRLEPAEALTAESGGNLDVAHLLKIALKNEMEATELAARWIESTPEVDVKLGFARQVGDESKHYRMIEDRLKAMGVDLGGFNPVGQGYGELFQYLTTLTDTVERLAAGQFTREAIALVKNRQFIELCEAKGDHATAKLYREAIQPDEKYHHELGRRMLQKYAVTDEQQERARRASRKTLELAEELSGLARRKAGIHHAPGC
ncbi:MAG: ferritin-like domain-containing protein [Candidatus Methylomirabilis oxyfera]|nr:ferritin-like domain-containing protein [Candidatus Methylomirabilis oxyfera]